MDSDDSDFIDSDTEALLYSQIHHDIPSAPLQHNDISIKAQHTHLSEHQLKNIGNLEPKKRLKNSDSPTSSHPVKIQNKPVASEAVCWSTLPNVGISGNQEVDATSFTSPSWSTRPVLNRKAKVSELQTTSKPVFKRELSVVSRPTVMILDEIDLQAERQNRKPMEGKVSDCSERLTMKRDKLIRKRKMEPVLDSSSDSSDVIILDNPEKKNQKVVINLDSSTDSCIIISEDEKNNVTGEDSCVIISEDDKNNGDHESLWKINIEDRAKRLQPRDRLMNVMCFNCRERGHLSKHCKKPKRFETCFLCGEQGHKGDECINPICSKCHLPGHWTSRCRWKPRQCPPCPLCQTRGHLGQECPSIWRRYHLTTSPGPLKTVSQYPPKPKNSCFCYNCGREGHYGYACGKKRKYNSFPVNRIVTDYSDPTKVLLKKSYVKLWRRKMNQTIKVNGSCEANINNLEEARKKRRLLSQIHKRKKMRKAVAKGAGANTVRIDPVTETSFPRSKKIKKTKSSQQSVTSWKGKGGKKMLHRTVFQGASKVT